MREYIKRFLQSLKVQRWPVLSAEEQAEKERLERLERLYPKKPR
ncbi:hypothetical protein SCREM2_gp54 [Synechococcus phage S-CREM2]|nr:hypothetical protein SCREM2_gp54 [Synechococcus phage S-CREM2]